MIRESIEHSVDNYQNSNDYDQDAYDYHNRFLHFDVPPFTYLQVFSVMHFIIIMYCCLYQLPNRYHKKPGSPLASSAV